MQYNKLKILLIGLLVVSVSLPLWHTFGMNRIFIIDQNSGYPIITSQDSDVGGSSTAKFKKDKDGLTMICHYSRDYHWPFCSFNIQLTTNTEGIDLSKYDKIELDIETYGARIQSTRIFLRNFNPAYSIPNDVKLLKPNGMQYIPNESETPLILPLKIFQVASWWIDEYNIPPEHSAPELTHITDIEVSTGNMMDEGMHMFIIKSIKFHGKWISQSLLQSIIITLWGLWALFFLIQNFWKAQKHVQAIKAEKNELESVNSALKLKHQALKVKATHDELTGCLNRYGLRNLLFDKVRQLREHNTPLSIIMMDLDFFKVVNDTHGHDVGDTVLKQFTYLMKDSTRHDDYLCRWGGEEFLLLCHGTGLEQAQQLAEKLRRNVETYSWQNTIKLTSSFGVAQMHASEEFGDFLKRVDKALYKAKENGRNRVFIEQLKLSA